MSADLPTEEDMLAYLVLYAARPVMTNCYATVQLDERDAWNAAVAPRPTDPSSAVAVLALGRLRAHPSLEAAIADSERRLEVERARGAVVDRARRMGGYLTDHAFVRDMAEAANRLIDAEDALAEVSRHGG